MHPGKQGTKSRDGAKKPTADSVSAPTPTHGIRVGLRSSPTKPALLFEDNPESILRKSHKSRILQNPYEAREMGHVPERSRTLNRHQHQTILNWIASVTKEQKHYLDCNIFYERSSGGTSLPSRDGDPVKVFYRKWGYLPPLDEETLEIIDAIIANPDMANEYKRVGPRDEMFPHGLRLRNVSLTESAVSDPCADRIASLVVEEPLQETDRGRESYERLWTHDRDKCGQHLNEALFQRTLMMSLIGRRRLIYEVDGNNQRYLDFSLEQLWTCPPMPTRAYDQDLQFLTQPKPDLAISFRAKALVPDHLWNQIPVATMRLAYYESMKSARVFHFFTIEGQNSMATANDTIGMLQSLNNASQALHNMYEFFRDAGPQHEEIFFSKVRFFSAVACAQGLTIRIHRATREPADGTDQGFITPGYPLIFEYRVFFQIDSSNFDGNLIFEEFEKILVGYGVNELRLLLYNAAAAIVENLKDDAEGMNLRRKDGFYRYGQTDYYPGQRKYLASRPMTGVLTNTPGRGAALQVGTGTTMQTRSMALALREGPKAGRKRRRGESESDESARKTRQRIK